MSASDVVWGMADSSNPTKSIIHQKIILNNIENANRTCRLRTVVHYCTRNNEPPLHAAIAGQYSQ